MKTKDEALKMAIEAMCDFDYDKRLEAIQACKEALEQPPPEVEPFDVWAGTNPKRTYEDKNKVYIAINVMHKNKLIHLLRIQRNEDKKYYIELNDLMRFINMSNSKLEQPAQEPVAWMQASEINYIKAMKEEGIKEWRTCLGMNHEAGDVALYTNPAPSWQGLSDGEKLAIIRKWKDAHTMREQELIGLGDAIEQALKEKNHANNA